MLDPFTWVMLFFVGVFLGMLGMIGVLWLLSIILPKVCAKKNMAKEMAYIEELLKAIAEEQKKQES